MAINTTKIPSGYKQTKIGIIPEDWEVKKLGEIGTFFKGKGVPKKDIKKEGFKCLTYGDLYTKYDIKIENVKSFIDKEAAAISQKIIYGDICFAGSGETIEDIGKSAVFVGDKFGYAGGDIIIFRAKEKLDTLTLSYILNSNFTRSQTFRMGQGHSVVHIYSSQLQKLQIPLPPLPEQRAIAACLSTWDKAIEKNQKLIDQLKERNKGLMQQLLTGKIRLKDGKGERFCGEWKEVDINKNIKLQGGYAFKSKEFKDFGIPIVRISNIQDNKINITEAVYYDGEISNNFIVRFGDILIAMSGATTGKIGIYMHEDKAYLNQRVGNFKLKNEEMKKLFLQYLVLSQIFKRIVYRDLEQGAQPNISPNFFNGIQIKLPSIEEQTVIAAVLDKATQEVQLQEEKLAALKEQKKGLMQVLLTGKLRLRSAQEKRLKV